MSTIKTMVRGAYDIQKLRIQMGNRIVMNYKAKLGQEPSKPESELGTEEKKIIDLMRINYKKITDGVIGDLPSKKNFKGNEVISEYSELCLVDQYIGLEQSEIKSFKQLEKSLLEYPIYTEFLLKVKGCGAAMSGVIISEINIANAKYASSLWKYAGLDVINVIENGIESTEGRCRKKQHLVESTYTDREGEEKVKMGISFNPFLKTKLTGVLAASFLKCKSPYSDIYYNYRNRLDNHPKHKDKTKLHKMNMSKRYMIKRFLVDLYANWRALEGLEVHPEYSEGKLGIVHTGD